MLAHRPPMRLYSAHQQVAAQGRPAPAARVVAIGNFDGVHRGHQQLLATAAAAVPPGQGAVDLLVLSFWPHPARVLAPHNPPPPLITTRARKRELIAACGVDGLLEEPFTLELAALTPEAFVEQILLSALRATHVCVGFDFTFGKGRAGNTQILAELLGRRGAGLSVVPAFTIPNPEDPGAPILCSSTRVRKAVQAGDVDLAARVLGRPVELEGEVVRGAGRGRTIGVPTANLAPETELAPATGVYAAWAEFPDPHSPHHGRRYPAAMNVGYNPTFSSHDKAISMEAHLLREASEHALPDLGDLYGQRLRLSLVARLRAEQRFSSVEALVQQIRLDIDTASTLLSA